MGGSAGDHIMAPWGAARAPPICRIQPTQSGYRLPGGARATGTASGGALLAPADAGRNPRTLRGQRPRGTAELPGGPDRRRTADIHHIHASVQGRVLIETRLSWPNRQRLPLTRPNARLRENLRENQ